jgi:hypothetical protein
VHILAVGRSYCGKSTLFRHIAKAHRKAGRGSLIWLPRMDEKWKTEVRAQFMTYDGQKFLEVAKKNTKKILVVEDAANQIGRYARDFGWLATDSRHNGHLALFGTQRLTGLDPIIRDNCSYIYGFTCSYSNAKILASDFVCDEFLKCPNLPLGSYIYLDLMTGKVTQDKLF